MKRYLITGVAAFATFSCSGSSSDEAASAEDGVSGNDGELTDGQVPAAEDSTVDDTVTGEGGDPHLSDESDSGDGLDTTDSDDGSDDGEGEVADCSGAEGWETSWEDLEKEVLRLVNQERAEGATCGAQSFAATAALQENEQLRCAARRHSKDMHERFFVSHFNPSGEDPWDRIVETGYSTTPVGENIATGPATANEVVAGWMNSPGHCASIMNPDFQGIGIGYFPGGQYGHLWTQTFGGSK